VAGAVGAAREVDRTEPLKEPSNGRPGPPEYPRNIREMMRGGARLALLVALSAACSSAQNQLPPMEVAWLRSFYESTGGEYWVNNDGWQDGAGAGWDPAVVAPCPENGAPGWLGIICRGEQQDPKPWNILGVSLAPGDPGVPRCSGNNLTGHLPDSFGGVPQLSMFKVAGPVPACVGQPEGTRCDTGLPDVCLGGIGQLAGELPTLPANAGVFAVYDTHVSGPLPSVLPSDPSVGVGLEQLLLGNNRLTGTVPWQAVPATLNQLQLRDNVDLQGTLAETIFTNAQALQYVLLFNTQLSGAVPRLPASLKELQLHKNAMTVLPEYLEVLTNLEMLTLDIRFRGAEKGGTIPDVIEHMKSLKTLKLSAGQWRGNIPEWMGDLSQLTDLELYDNSLTGTIPSSLCNLQFLEKLMLSNNVLDGEIPPCLGDLKSLTQLWLNHNELSGVIPPQLSQLTQVKELPMNNNHLTGTIPPQLGQLSELTTLMLNDNSLSIDGDSMDVWLSQLSKLTAISLSRNAEIKTLPRTSLAQLASLKKVEISGSKKQHSMALDLQLPSSLQVLDLAENTFGASATIPYEINDPEGFDNNWGNLNDLTFFDMSDCGLSDDFDPNGFLATRDKLETLHLSGNNLTKVPDNLHRLYLRTLDLGYNNLKQSATDTMLDIAPGLNKFTRVDSQGASVSARVLERLDLSHNYITGSIPSNLFSTAWGVDRLTVLDLSHNEIEGTFPHIFATLRLFSIDVSANRLSGHLHQSLAILHSLHLLDVRENEGMRECADTAAADDCTGQLQMTTGSTVLDKGDALCYEVATDELPHAQLLLDPSYSTSSECVCKDEYIGSRGECAACAPRYTEHMPGEEVVTILDCRSVGGVDASRLRDGFAPVWCSSKSAWNKTWGALNCTAEESEDELAPLAVVRCPVVARDHNPCMNEQASSGYSELGRWRQTAKSSDGLREHGCAAGYAGPACMSCDRPKYARELGSRICTECDEWSEIVPWLYLLAMIALVTFLARKDASPSNLGSSFIFYFQAMTLIKRSVLPWPDQNGVWMEISSGLNFNPAMSACVSYLRFLEDAEARFWFTMALPLFVVAMVLAVWGVGVGYDCWLKRGEQPDLNAGSARLTAGGQNYIASTRRGGSELQPLIAQDRAMKVLFALINLCYLPLCFTTISASHVASLPFEFIGDTTNNLQGRYLVNAPTINVPDELFTDDPTDPWWLNTAARLELGFYAGLLAYVIAIPVAIYMLVYRRIQELDADREKRFRRQFPGGHDSMTVEQLRETSQRQDVELEQEMDKQARIVRIGGAAFCAFKYEYRWWPFLVTLRKVAFTWVIAFFPPDDPWLSVLVFVVLLIALLLQVENSPMMGRLDNALEQFTLGVLLVCFTLAQVVMADRNQSRAVRREVDSFTDVAQRLDQLVIFTFILSICLRKALEYTRFAEALKKDHRLWKRSWGVRITDVLTIRTSTSSPAMSVVQERDDDREEELFQDAPAAADLGVGLARPANPARGVQAPLLAGGRAASGRAASDAEALFSPLHARAGAPAVGAGVSRPASPGSQLPRNTKGELSGSE
jgi:Leucine-rich repeat (LRR) protein